MKMKITVEKIIRYYVEEEGWVFGGPFETKEEAKQCLKNYKANQQAIKTAYDNQATH
jgi:hypothetical protein